MNNKEIKDFFNNICPYWDNSKDDIELIKYLLKEIELKENDKVLDLGCGKGIITPYIYEITKNKVMAMDLSDKMIEDAMKLHPQSTYEFICDDFYNHSFKETFDYIVIYNAYPHFMDVSSLSDKCYQILNKNGKIAIIHSLGRNRLNNHHSNITNISRNIDIPENEYQYFKDKFVLLKGIDEEDKIIILLEKKVS